MCREMVTHDVPSGDVCWARTYQYCWSCLIISFVGRNVQTSVHFGGRMCFGMGLILFGVGDGGLDFRALSCGAYAWAVPRAYCFAFVALDDDS